MNKKKQSPYSVASKVLTVVFILLCLIWIFPIFQVVINSFKSNASINTNAFAMPSEESFVGFNNYIKGSSLIGEGLASCLYSFPSLGDEERTRAIIMATDNAQENISTPLVELKEACELCRKNDVTVFAIFPDRETFNKGNNRDYDADKSDLRNNIAVTGGEYYEQSANLTTEDIVKDIQRQEALEVDEITVTRMTDKPVGLIIALFCCLAGLLVTGLMLKR